MEERKPIRFVISKIEEEKFFITDNFPENRDSLKLSTGIVFNFNVADHVIAPTITFVYKNDENVLFELTARCEFTLDTESWEAFKDTKGTLIPVSFLQYLAFNAISTIRGIVFCRTRNTPLADFVIPMINVENIVKENILIPFAGQPS